MSVLSSSHHLSEGAGLEALILLNCSSVESADLTLPSTGRPSALGSARGLGPSSEALIKIRTKLLEGRNIKSRSSKSYRTPSSRMSVLSSSHHLSEGAGLEALILLNCSSVESADLTLPSTGRPSALGSARGLGPSSEALIKIRTGLVACLLLVGNKRSLLESRKQKRVTDTHCRGAQGQQARTCMPMNGLMLLNSRQLVLNRTLGSYTVRFYSPHLLPLVA
ncbi:uncharacterized protein LOC106511243 [Austrofundulus limnaeus]|uniref:Uncharacterized protein LOC106511243 n=1 Tax=Austrofundulus limnaeus TaxID=52670 RepID=A0A2I4AIY5_AUSLI|nr:PREDICTED: uncharacterized protein LOC106511243 [Austrofundulus limnaeus]